jgi:glyoxylase-like metal-dependent hydrolase (beta-lactamase superfamily II)
LEKESIDQTSWEKSTMSVSIYSKRLGINYAYLIQGESWILFDTGPRFSAAEIEKWFSSLHMEPEELQLIVLSHGHFDHAGAAADIKKLTGAKIVVHREDQEMVETAEIVMPSAVTRWGKVTRKMMEPVMSIFQFKGSPVDIIITDEGLSLEDYGIPGRIIHTPGHTPGSISVLLDTGDAFVGCMTHNAPPFRTAPNHPIFAEDLDLLWESWKVLIDLGAKTIYPGHGRPFPVSKILGVIP